MDHFLSLLFCASFLLFSLPPPFGGPSGRGKGKQAKKEGISFKTGGKTWSYSPYKKR